MGLFTRIRLVVVGLAYAIYCAIRFALRFTLMCIWEMIYLDGKLVVPNIITGIISIAILVSWGGCGFEQLKKSKTAEHKFEREQLKKDAYGYFNLALSAVLLIRLILIIELCCIS